MLDFAWALYLAEKMLSDLLGYEKVSFLADFVFCLCAPDATSSSLFYLSH